MSSYSLSWSHPSLVDAATTLLQSFKSSSHYIILWKVPLGSKSLFPSMSISFHSRSSQMIYLLICHWMLRYGRVSSLIQLDFFTLSVPAKSINPTLHPRRPPTPHTSHFCVVPFPCNHSWYKISYQSEFFVVNNRNNKTKTGCFKEKWSKLKPSL